MNEESKSEQPFCSICQTDAPIGALIYKACDITTVPQRNSMIELDCHHVFHLNCLVEWLSFCQQSGTAFESLNDLSEPLGVPCPLCRDRSAPGFLFNNRFRVRNIAVPTTATPDSLARGLRSSGWFNVIIAVIAPPGITVDNVVFTFHPAFSLANVRLHKEPYELIVKLCTNRVAVVIDVEYHRENSKKENFKFCHFLEKRSIVRSYFKGSFTGFGEDGCDVIDSPENYFSNLLSTYNRDSAYYEKSPITPSRLARNRKQGFWGYIKSIFN